jgi:type VI protein secretion system component VasK
VAESRTRRRWFAFAVALVLALAGLGFLGWSIVQHRDARDDLAAARADLVTRRGDTSSDAKKVQQAQAAIAGVHDQLGALDQGVGGLADHDDKDLEQVRAAIQAGLGGNLAGYNAAVDQRAALDPQHDATVDQLRQQANAVITALDPLG